jgi:apolipoprotein N-acyltransferase
MLVPLFLALERATPARAALLAGGWLWASGCLVARWLVHALVGEYGVRAPAAWAFLGLLGLTCAAPLAAAAWAFGRLRPRAGLLGAPCLLAALWTAGEWPRAAAGVPWMLAAHPLAPLPAAYQIADLGGVTAPGFVLVAWQAGLALALARRRARPLVLPSLLAAASLGYGTFRLAGPERGGPQYRIGVVQAAVAQPERFQPGSAARNVRRHAELTRKLAAAGPLDLVVWSETSVDTDLDRAPGLAAQLAALAAGTGVPLVTGTARSQDGRRTNSVVLFTPQEGLAGSYAKQRLVPFSEYDPPLLGWLSPLLAPLSEGEPYVPGELRLLPGPLPLATPVCFEITYPGLLRRFRAAGALLVLNLSNDAWFGRTGYPAMHLAHARFRAVELRSFVVRAANTGISAVIDPAGRILASLPVFEEGTLEAEVAAAGAPPLYARLGDGPVLAIVAALALVAVWRPAPKG